MDAEAEREFVAADHAVPVGVRRTALVLPVRTAQIRVLLTRGAAPAGAIVL